MDSEIDRLLAEGKGWSPEEFKAYCNDIGDNHPLFAESIEVGSEGNMEGGMDGETCVCVWIPIRLRTGI